MTNKTAKTLREYSNIVNDMVNTLLAIKGSRQKEIDMICVRLLIADVELFKLACKIEDEEKGMKKL